MTEKTDLPQTAEAAPAAASHAPSLTDEDIAALAGDDTASDDELRELGILDRVTAFRAQQAEGGAAEGEGGESGETEIEPAAAGADATKDAEKPGEHVPVKRLNSEVARRKAAEEESLELRKQLLEMGTAVKTQGEILQEMLKGRGNGQQQEVQKPRDPVAEVSAQIKALDERYDEGDLDEREYRDQRDALQDRKSDLKIQAAQAKASGIQQDGETPPTMMDAVTAAQEVRELAAANDWTTAVPPELFDEMRVVATLRTQAKGFTNPADPRADLVFKRELVEVGRSWGFDVRYGGQAKSATTTTQPQRGTDPSGKPTQAIRAGAGKLALAANAPPDISRLPPAGQDLDQYTEERLGTMDPRVIAALPPAVRQRIMERLGVQ